MKRPNTILVTREEERVPLLKQWCNENNITLIAKSFISIQSIKGLDIPKTDWIFFNSPKGLDSYLSQYPILANKIGVYGIGTSNALLRHGHTANFIGESGLSPRLIGQRFNQRIGTTETVLFPVGQQSKRSIAQEINQQNCIELNTYFTEIVPLKLSQKHDILIFTSPSNVDGYLLKNLPSVNSFALAIGPTTANALREKMYENEILEASKPTEEAIITLLGERFNLPTP